MSKDTASTVVPPFVPSGFQRWRGAIFGGLVFLTIVYVVVHQLLRESTFVQPDAKFCASDEPCFRPDLFAFQVSSGIMQLFMGITGFMAWHIHKKSGVNSLQTPEGRLFGFLQAADRLNAGIFVFQVWDFLASLFIPEHRTAVFLTHHVLAALTAYFSLEYQLVHYYAIFFGGCSEISSIFLVFCDFDVYFPSHRTNAVWGGIILLSQVCFTLAFLYYRVVGWWHVSWHLWKDALCVFRKHEAQQYRPQKVWFLHVFLTMDVILGLLQLYWWMFGILPKVMEVQSDGVDS